MYLLVDADLEDLVIVEGLGAEDEPEVVLGDVPDGRSLVVREAHTVAALAMKHFANRLDISSVRVSPIRSPFPVSSIGKQANRWSIVEHAARLGGHRSAIRDSQIRRFADSQIRSSVCSLTYACVYLCTIVFVATVRRTRTRYKLAIHM